VVPASGGPVRTLTTPDPDLGEIRHAWPDAVAGTAAVLFVAAKSPRGADPGRAAVVDVQSGEVTRLGASATDARVVPFEHVLLSAPGVSSLVPVDSRWTFVTGSALALPDRVRIDPQSGGAALAIATTGVRLALDDVAPGRTWQWLRVETGRLEPTPTVFDGLDDLAVTPDGGRVAGIERHGSRDELWVVDPARATRVRALTAPGLSSPAWSPDGTTIAVTRTDPQARQVVYGAADATGAWQALPGLTASAFPSGWSPDGGAVLLSLVAGEHGFDVGMLAARPGGSGGSTSVATAADEIAAAISPDGRWLAYQTNEAGRWAVAVRPAEGSGGTVVVSADARSPAWIDDRTLVFLSGDRVMRTSTTSDSRFDPAPPITVVDRVAEVARGVASDGRLLVQGGLTTSAPGITLEWFDDVRARLEAVRPLPRSFR
jgi:dipeptidyl aminopeptidase/acylaminoacyl peptidase